MNSEQPLARFIMVGGFLGAGKTTAILRLAEHFRRQNLRVGLITNDQSYGLVDSKLLGSHGFAVEEITGGCFCCRFNSLVEASEKLSAAERPDFFIAEPVGSCTDLKATVDYPLRRLFGDNFRIAPLSVLVDPVRAARILGLEPGPTFSEKVLYIYRKQLEEAELIVVNKIDLLSAEQLERLVKRLRSEFPRAQVLSLSARQERGFDAWLAQLQGLGALLSGAMDVDYDTYAQGEELLGWLNSAAQIDAASPIDGNQLIRRVAALIADRVRAEGGQIAHLKLTLTPDVGSDIGVANLVRNDGQVELSHQLLEPIDSAELILNLRAEAAPERLEAIARTALQVASEGLEAGVTIGHLEAFRPGRPTPTHRLDRV